MLDPATIHEIVSQITYKPGWSIQLRFDDPPFRHEGDVIGGTRPYVQLSVDETSDASLDSVKRDGSRTPWKSAKRYLSLHMCRQEIVGAVFGLIQDAEMHELREWFRYRNASIFNPHLDPDVLAAVARKASSFVVRENAMSMTEESAANG